MTRGTNNQQGTSAVDYGLIVAGVAAAIIVPLQALDVGVRAAFPEETAQGECGTVAPPPGVTCP